jgi:predicted DNA-binding transcriptional regulator YafY
MSRKEALVRQSTIMHKLKQGRSTFQQIKDYLERKSEIDGYNYIISQRTFQRDLNDIRSMYNVEIQCDKSTFEYYIEHNGAPNINSRMLEAFDMFYALNLTADLSNHIHFENRKPHGTEHFHGILHAISHSKITTFKYQKFWDESPEMRRVAPLALKEFKGRWYLIALDLNDHNKLKTFGLDRISELHMLRETFERPADFDVDEHFRYCFGVINTSDEAPDEIVLSFTAFQGKYIKTMPLHHSQEILIDNEDELRIQLKMFATHDFLMELQYYGDQVKVLEPQKLVSQIKRGLAGALGRYE